MEVGAVKQAFNNEVIHLKKKLYQARIQVIHKLIRKSKTLTQKKGSNELQEKFKRKAESCVNEVLLIKKITTKELAKFAVTHKGELKDFLNKPIINHDRACARLLLHKSLEDKYEFLRQRFTNIPIHDLLMSRDERRKAKKEAREMNSKKVKDSKNSVEDKWKIEDIQEELENEINDSKEELDNDESEKSVSASENEFSDNEGDQTVQTRNSLKESLDSKDNLDTEYIERDQSKNVTTIDNKSNEFKETINPLPKSIKKKEAIVKVKTNKNLNKKNSKKLSDKILMKNFNKEKKVDCNEANKVVDTFFMTSSGENYMSLVEPREPDEVKEVHRQGNRKLRRAVMFGNVPKFRPRLNQQKFENQNVYKDDKSNFKNDKSDWNSRKAFDKNVNSFKGAKKDFESENRAEKPEKLHPSWEAKKRQSGLLPFQGKKIVFS